MIRSIDLRYYIVRPVLTDLGMWSEAAEELMLGTCAVESDLGYYLKQSKGPARGIYMVEPDTERDLWDNYILSHQGIMRILTKYGVPYMPDDREMIWNLNYATAMARLVYWRVPDPLPVKEDIVALETYHKRHYNTHLGKTKKGEFVEKYQKYV